MREVESREETIEALSVELSARENQISAIINSRAWRWVSRYGRLKHGYFAPTYEKLRSLYQKNKRVASSTANGASRYKAEFDAPKNGKSDPAHESLVLLPRPRVAKLSGMSWSETPAITDARADVICFSIIDWDFRYQRPQQIISQFAANGHRVFYIRLHQVLPESGTRRFHLSKLKKNVYEVTLAAGRQPRINQEDFKNENGETLLASLDALRHAYHIDEAIGYVMSPSWTTIALETKQRWGWRVIYDCMDEWAGFPGMGPTIPKAEQRLARECDLLVVTAQRLYAKWRPLNRSLVLARNAVDNEFYRQRSQPNALLENEKRPIIGYYGAIADWFDVKLMTHVARERPDYTFVLLGGIFEVNVSELESLPNVQFLGQQPYEKMPQYLSNFD